MSAALVVSTAVDAAVSWTTVVSAPLAVDTPAWAPAKLALLEVSAAVVLALLTTEALVRMAVLRLADMSAVAVVAALS